VSSLVAVSAPTLASNISALSNLLHERGIPRRRRGRLSSSILESGSWPLVGESYRRTHIRWPLWLIEQSMLIKSYPQILDSSGVGFQRIKLLLNYSGSTWFLAYSVWEDRILLPNKLGSSSLFVVQYVQEVLTL